MLFLPNLKRLFVSEQGQEGYYTSLKVLPISGNVTAAVPCKHFIQIKIKKICQFDMIVGQGDQQSYHKDLFTR